MNNRHTILSISAVLFLLSCTEKKAITETKAVDSVGVFVLRKETVTKSMLLPVELYPWERAEIFAKVEGFVKELKVDIGDGVRKNDVLVIIDAPEVTSIYAKALADLQASQAKFKSSSDTYQRTVNADKEKGTVSDSELEHAKNQMVSDSGTFVAAQSSANAYGQLKNYLIIRAAFDGVITQRNIDPGTLVGVGSKPMFVLENLGKLRLRIAIPEIYTSALPDTSFISFTVDAQPSKKYKATLTRKSNLIDQKTRTELWEFEVNNSNQELKSGMYGNANFKLHRKEVSFTVPYSAVITSLERNFVIRIKDGKAEWVDVKNGINLKDKIEIFGDLGEGDLIVLKPNEEIKSGQPILPKQK